MRILIVSDTPRDGWAIGKLSDAIIRNNEQLHIDFVAVHPKEVDRDIGEFKKLLAEKPDVIHFQYWRSTKQLFDLVPELKNFKTIQTHHNQKETLSVNWKELKINQHIVHTEKNKKILTDAGYENVEIIQHGIDLNYFSYFREYKGDTGYVGYVGRVVPWKGLKEIAKATRSNGLKVCAMGRMDKPNYWKDIPLEDRNIIDFLYNNVPDNERINAYRDMMCFVQNSSDGREEGTLPLLEAMACGIPVISTPSGEAADIINDGENGFIVPFGNEDALRVKIKMLKNDPELREKLRKNAWQTIKNFTEEKMARKYAKIYYQILFGKYGTVSAITPVYNSLHEIIEIYKALREQTYSITEWIIIDDNSADNDKVEHFANSIRSDAPFAIRYINTRKDGYNLAMARNMGIVEALGRYLLFLDSRLRPDPTAVAYFLRSMKQGEWCFGNKGANKKTFVENFSFVERSDLIKAGMFCERINRYGGMSQEVRQRWLAQGRKIRYVPEAYAEIQKGSSMTTQRRRDIIAMKLKLYKMGL